MSGTKTTKNSPWRLHGRRNKPSTPARLLLLRAAFNSLGYLLPNLVSRLAFWLWFRTFRVTAPAREQRLLDRATPQFFETGDMRIASWSWGQGPRVLLVHGWNGRGAQLGSFVQPLVDAGYRVITLDLPGHGQSPGKQTDIFEVSKTLCLLGELHGPFESVIAHSFGSVCVAAAVKDGLQTRSVVSISSPSGFDSLLQHFAEHMRLPGRVMKKLEHRLLRYVGPGFWEEFATHFAANGQRSLLIHDQDDHVVPLSEARQLMENWPRAELYITSGLGHRRILKNREVIRKTLSFIQSAPEPALATGDEPQQARVFG